VNREQNGNMNASNFDSDDSESDWLLGQIMCALAYFSGQRLVHDEKFI
jgi:hypothetical protein